MTDRLSIALNDAARVPWLAFGTGTAHYSQDAANIVKLAINSGFRHLDGAQMYNNEESMGRGIKASGKPREELYIVTKLKTLAPGETVTQSLQTSLKKLGLNYVDLFLIHTPSPANKEGKLKEIWKGMEEVKKLGLTKSIGVSNFRIEDLKEVLDSASVIPAVNQIELHPYVWKAAAALVAFGAGHGITTASYGGQSPLARMPEGPLTPVLESIRDRLQRTRGAPVSTSQVLIKWIRHKGAIVVTTSSKKERIEEYLDSANVPDLTEEEIMAIDDTGSTIHKRFFMNRIFDT